MISLNALMIDCGVGKLTRALYIECDLPEETVKQVQQQMAEIITRALTDNGQSVVKDFSPTL